MHKKPQRSKTKWNCLDCQENTKYEHYFVRTEVWLNAVGSTVGMLCVGCLESRLCRSLVPSDFTGAHINNPKTNAMTDRLRNRITGLDRC